jgi:2,4-diacetylphloroglucinol hydrolase
VSDEGERHDARRHPVTYFPVATQRQFRRNRAAIAGKPYEHFFDGDLWLHDDVLPALREPMPVEHALAHDPSGFDRLLEPGYLDGETGYCELANGAAYVASLVPFPECTGEMLSWWFWWHAVEPARYTLWYPYNHVRVRSSSPERLTQPGLGHAERYLGTSHHVVEYIGPKKVDILIDFIDPAELGMDTSRFDDAGIVAHACAHVRSTRPRARIVTMLHLARATRDGLELRSRYWIGDDVRLEVAGRQVRPERLLDGSRLRRRLAGAAVGYEQLLHDQIEFTHLSSFLARIHGEFGSAPPGG